MCVEKSLAAETMTDSDVRLSAFVVSKHRYPRALPHLANEAENFSLRGDGCANGSRGSGDLEVLGTTDYHLYQEPENCRRQINSLQSPSR